MLNFQAEEFSEGGQEVSSIQIHTMLESMTSSQLFR